MIKDPLWFIGVVENNIDSRLEGRVQVRAFGFHGTVEDIPTVDLPWATLVLGSFDPNTPPPPLNSWVIGAFIDGRDAQQPLIFGILPTQMINPVDPTSTGWGNIDVDHYDRAAYGSRPSDIGQPMSSRLSRGENIDETYVLSQETTRSLGVETASGGTWDEPGAAYSAQYPYNRVFETAGGSSIELDDTPGSERIMVYHQAGSFIQIDQRGTAVYKTASDQYTVIEGNGHTHISGSAMMTVDGNLEVLIKGNKIEKIMGDHVQIVQGNSEYSSAGQLNLNASDHVQVASARVAIASLVENTDITGAKAVKLGGASLQFSSTGDGSVSVAGKLSLSGEGSAVLGSGGKVSVSGSTVALDDIVTMANGESDSVSQAEPTSGVEIAESPSKAIGISPTPATLPMGSAGYAANDDPLDDFNPADLARCGSTNLIDFLKNEEGFSAKPYRDGPQWSVGYGTATSNPNEVIDTAEALRRLESRVASDRAKVVSKSKAYGYNWNDCQIDAMTSFVYNLGIGALDQVTANGTRDGGEIAAKMLEYSNATVDGKRVQLPALVKRRSSESNWFASSASTTSTPEGTLI